MVSNVIGVINYVIAARPSLLNFMIADTAGNAGAITDPQAVPRAANRLVVTCRTWSWVVRAGVVGITGRIGAVRLMAWIWLFVRHEALHYRAEVEGLRRRSVAAGR